MKYIWLVISIILGISGFCQAMAAMAGDGLLFTVPEPVVMHFGSVTWSFTQLSTSAHVLILSAGFFAMYLIVNRLRSLRIGPLKDYIPC